MHRLQAIKLIRSYLTTHQFKMYINPDVGVFHFEDALLDKFRVIPDIFDRQQALAKNVLEMYAKCPLELRDVPLDDYATMGQAEFFLNRKPLYVIFLDGSWYCSSREWFPFD